MIEINNLTSFFIDKKFLKRVSEVILKEEKVKGQISLAVVGPKKIQNLNKKYRRINQPTDVLAFPESNGLDLQLRLKPVSLGEIVICPKEIKRNYRKFRVSFKEELARVLIHGILHLLGYTHEKSKVKAEKMQKKEQYYLSEIKN